MTDRILALAQRALREDIYVNYKTNRNPDYDGYPKPIMTAMNIRDFLLGVPARFQEGELLSEGFHINNLPVTGCAYKHTGHSSWASFFRPHSDYMPNPLVFVDWNHYCNNYDFIVNRGFKAYLPKIGASREKFAGDKDKLDFLDGLEIVCGAIKGLSENMGQRVPFEPARTFAEAVQSVWIAFLLMPDSLGRLDQVLYPFYRRDIDNGILTKALAEEYIGELFVKVFNLGGFQAHRSGDNTLVVGGYTHTGDDGFNELSETILRARVSLPVWRPQISFRWTAKTPFEAIKLVAELNSKCSDITFSNDEVFLKAFEKLSVDKEDAIDYTKVGCNEWAIVGKSNSGSDGYFNTLSALEEMLHFHSGEISSVNSFEDFYQLFLKYLDHSIMFLCDLADAYYDANSRDMNVLSSLMIEGCIENARSLTAGGAKYNVSCWAAIGIINLADSLSSIKQFVYDEKIITLPELCRALNANWKGYEDLRSYIVNHGRFFGNDDDYVDMLVNRLITDLNASVNRHKPRKGGEYRFGCFIGYNSAHITMGLRTRATPDGRFDGEAFTAGIIAEPGRDLNGLTAYLKSAGKLDYTLLCGPLAVNLRLDKKMADSTERLAHLYETYFKLGGMQLQPDYISTEDLKDAQAHPEKWSGLRVRVTGFSGFFVLFDRKLQNEIIARTEHGV